MVDQKKKSKFAQPLFYTFLEKWLQIKWLIAWMITVEFCRITLLEMMNVKYFFKISANLLACPKRLISSRDIGILRAVRSFKVSIRIFFNPLHWLLWNSAASRVVRNDECRILRYNILLNVINYSYGHYQKSAFKNGISYFRFEAKSSKCGFLLRDWVKMAQTGLH